MNNLNSVLLEGNLVKDPERRDMEGHGPLVKFSIAVDRSYKDGQERIKEVMYMLIETWGKLAENCGTFLKKGRKVRVVGRLRQNRWEEDGKIRSRYSIVAEHVEFVPERRTEEKQIGCDEEGAKDTGEVEMFLDEEAFRVPDEDMEDDGEVVL
ncbi:single-stranded DNA-binding protein [Parasphaerochaeta coccoides]|uniref:Single-stranded DNA-binding protein n=1 Tax=Parasphaerochaeta coccoides (strain ATCC BAA-1237 / DSM 17374 / SPN1) TaxID=760011 RepID=F4GK80_PARC1|nr:single-stranded DNA-binding protein [Parasphaerochaeta coccoides]AEC02276.1 single-strand binding protein [Parasphaerochaeta coccoides DSM 17374]